MSNLHFDKSKFGKFLSGKGFYVALALCLLGTGAAAFIAVDQTLNRISDPSVENKTESVSPENGTASAQDWTYPSLEEANQPIKGVPAEGESSSVSSAAPVQDTGDLEQEQQALSGDPVYMLPISGEIVNPFSAGQLVKSKTLNDWRTHNGVDIKAKAGSPVKAVTDGKVTKVMSDGMWGTVIEIEHANNLTSIYKGLNDNVSVKAGQQVELGQVIGSVRETILCEVAEDTHLHFEMLEGSKYIEPLSALGKEELVPAPASSAAESSSAKPEE